MKSVTGRPFRILFILVIPMAGWVILPAEKEWKHGGYEVDMVCPFTPAMPCRLTESVVSYLQGELKGVKSGQPGSTKK